MMILKPQLWCCCFPRHRLSVCVCPYRDTHANRLGTGVVIQGITAGQPRSKPRSRHPVPTPLGPRSRPLGTPVPIPYVSVRPILGPGSR
jgi:hypothetical protein